MFLLSIEDIFMGNYISQVLHDNQNITITDFTQISICKLMLYHINNSITQFDIYFVFFHPCTNNLEGWFFGLHFQIVLSSKLQNI